MKVKLWDMIGIGLIVNCKSDCIYENQTGGTACFQSEYEGILVPINNDLQGVETQLETEITKILNNSLLSQMKKADSIDDLFQKEIETKFIAVDRSKMSESHEAWLHVVLNTDISECISGFGGLSGVLTWQNSD